MTSNGPYYSVSSAGRHQTNYCQQCCRCCFGCSLASVVFLAVSGAVLLYMFREDSFGDKVANTFGYVTENQAYNVSMRVCGIVLLVFAAIMLLFVCISGSCAYCLSPPKPPPSGVIFVSQPGGPQNSAPRPVPKPPRPTAPPRPTEPPHSYAPPSYESVVGVADKSA
ncbi:hypothetical protein Aperf_G00000018913 [Anoplocephala perfoliata]